MEIRLANREDIPRVMEFVKEHWGKSHILANKREFMEYQHCRDDKEFTYILAEENGKIYGIEGYIPMNGNECPDIAGALWKVIPCNYFMLGKALRDSLMKFTRCRYMCSPGINKDTSGKVLGMYGQFVEKMDHYYRLRNVDDYRIAVIKEKRIPLEKSEQRIHLKPVHEFEAMSQHISENYLKTKVPYKDKTYLQHRYFNHPVYQYDVYGIERSGVCRSFVIMREVAVNGSRMAKIVDFIGEDEDLAGLSVEWDRLMEEKEYELIDLYCYGIDSGILAKSGFVKRKECDENIIPNYFEPYEARNVDIYFVSNVLEGLHLYRGDGDQDRPSRY